mgnify:CR=1 FL=1
MKCIILQSPIVQLNTPYPSGAYLKSFFSNCRADGATYSDSAISKSVGYFSSVRWIDTNNLLFHRIFSPEGLTQIFESTENKALKMAIEAEKNGDENTAFNLRRYIATKNAWIRWIEPIKAILGCESIPEFESNPKRGPVSAEAKISGREQISTNNKISGRELCHEFIFSPFSPCGQRMDNYLADLEQNFGRQPTIDDARFLASFALADLADYITAIYDSNFSLIRYAEHLATSEKDFSKFERALESPILKNFLEPLISEINKDIKDDKDNKDDEDKIPSDADNKRTLFCVSVPFAGCFASALSICRVLRKIYGDNAIISLGGGYINTELRNINEKRLFKYADFISYDRGYGSYIDLMSANFARDGRTYYKTAYLFEDKILNTADSADSSAIATTDCDKIAQLENKLTLSTFPDYSDIDFLLYPRLFPQILPD